LPTCSIDIKDVDLVIQFDPPRDVDTYVHRSGRTGRAGSKGVSVLLFNPGQARDIVRIERDLSHGFRFDLVGPPSTEAALKAAAKTSAVACSTVPEETAEFFYESAQKLLAKDEDPAHVIAKCLAAISRRSADVQSRSLLTGELGLATVEMKNSNGRPINPNDVMFTVGKLSRMSQRDEELSFDNDVGKIDANPSTGIAVFDMPEEDAKALVEFAKDIDAGGNSFRIIHELEIERNQDFGRSWDRRGGRGGDRRGGRYNDRNGRGGGGGYMNNGRRDGGGSRFDRRDGGSNRNGRSRNYDHHDDGMHGRSFRGRYDGRRSQSEGRRQRQSSHSDGW
jgi:ATP-dependent RNA helicase DDX21